QGFEKLHPVVMTLSCVCHDSPRDILSSISRRVSQRSKMTPSSSCKTGCATNVHSEPDDVAHNLRRSGFWCLMSVFELAWPDAQAPGGIEALSFVRRGPSRVRRRRALRVDMQLHQACDDRGVRGLQTGLDTQLSV